MKKKTTALETIEDVVIEPSISSDTALYLFHSIINNIRNAIARNKLNKEVDNEKTIDILRCCSFFISSEDKKKLRKEIEEYNNSQCHMGIEDAIKLEIHIEEIKKDWLSFFTNHLHLFEKEEVIVSTKLHGPPLPSFPFANISIPDICSAIKELVMEYKRQIEEKLLSYYSIILPEEIGL